MMRTHLCGELTLADVGQRVSVTGWVNRRREHSQHLAFVDLRDHSGIVQCVVDNSVDVRSEYVVRVTGTVTEQVAPPVDCVRWMGDASADRQVAWNGDRMWFGAFEGTWDAEIEFETGPSRGIGPRDRKGACVRLTQREAPDPSESA